MLSIIIFFVHNIANVILEIRFKIILNLKNFAKVLKLLKVTKFIIIV